MLTTRHGRRGFARSLAAALVNTSTVGPWLALPESRRRGLTDRVEAILDEDDYAVAFLPVDTAQAAATGLIAAAA